MEKYCLICGEEIYRRKSHHSSKLRRSALAKTCSKECARIYRNQWWRRNARQKELQHSRTLANPRPLAGQVYRDN